MPITSCSLATIKALPMRSVKTLFMTSLLVMMAACGTLNNQRPQQLIEVNADQIELHANEGLFYFEETPFTGIALKYYDNGIVAESAQFQNGKRHGLLKKWYASGVMSYMANYKEGKYHEKTYSWWGNGKLRSESTFKAGIAHGIQKLWYSSGEPFKQLNLVEGKEDGMQKAWRKNGQLYVNYEARNGRTYGLKRSNLCYDLNEENIQLSESD